MAPLTGQRPAMPPAYKGFTHINRYWDRTHDMYAAKILPGEYYVTNHSELITTVLGSCVSACVRDKVFGIGGMNHFMLPVQAGDNPDDLLSAATRYGNYAMEHLINDILSHGGHRRNLEVKVFGGGQIMKGMTDIGRKNIEFVRHYLSTEGFHILAEDLGDIYPRKVVYDPQTGKVRVKKLKSLHNDTIIRRDQNYMHDIEAQPVAGDVELFD